MRVQHTRTLHRCGKMHPDSSSTNRLVKSNSHPVDECNMTVAQYNANKYGIRKHLCNGGDPRARLVRPGTCQPELAPRVVGLRLEELNRVHGGGYTLVRGYRLISMTSAVSAMRQVTYSAQSHLVIKTPTGEYESLTRSADDSRPTEPYIFVPSSRMHTDLTDAELLSGYWLLCTVVGGPPEITATLLRLRENMCDFEKRRLCATPEESRARRSLAIRQFPGYMKWSQLVSKLPANTYVDSVIAFGMPFRELTDAEMDVIFDGIDVRQTLSGEGDTSDFLKPEPPWQFDRSMWLPSVPKLHAEVERFVEVADGHDSAADVVFFPIYETLQEEYATRLVTCEERYRKEHASKYQAEFR